MRSRLLIVLAVILLSHGVALGARKDADPEQLRMYSFYPLPPDAPRVQFLVQFSSINDLGGKKKKGSAFTKWLLGSKKDDESGELNPRKAYGIAAAKGKIYVTDSTTAKIIVYDLVKSEQYAFESRGMGKLAKPVDIFVAPDGYIFVTDIGRKAIIVYDQDERYVTAYGQPGDFSPASVHVYGKEVFVADVTGCRIVVLDRDTGALKRVFGQKGKEEGFLNAPTSIAVTPSGVVYVSDTFNYRVQRFDLQGNFISAFGQAGQSIGTFHRPKGLTVTPGIVWVIDAAFEAVQMFNEDTKVLMSFGSADELVLPSRIACDSHNVDYFSKYVHPDFTLEYVVYVTNNFGPYAVSAYGFGSLKDASRPIGIEQLKPAPELKSGVTNADSAPTDVSHP